jgi:hypothetical protein
VKMRHLLTLPKTSASSAPCHRLGGAVIIDTRVHPAQIATSSLGGPAIVYMCVAGDVDMTCESALTRAAAHLQSCPPDTVYIDLGAVTFGGSTLLNFLVRVVANLPDASALVLCRPTPYTRELIRLTSPDLLATMREGLPHDWPRTGWTQ